MSSFLPSRAKLTWAPPRFSPPRFVDSSFTSAKTKHFTPFFKGRNRVFSTLQSSADGSLGSTRPHVDVRGAMELSSGSFCGQHPPLDLDVGTDYVDNL